MIGALLLPLLLLPAAAAAQEVPFSIEPTESCLARGGGEACIGRGAEACMAFEPGAYTTPRIGYCLEAERQYWDGALNAVFRELVAAERAGDADPIWRGRERPSGEEAARAMQRAWIAFRDATCNHEVLQWFGGSGAGGAFVGCLMRMTAEQTLYLRRRLEER